MVRLRRATVALALTALPGLVAAAPAPAQTPEPDPALAGADALGEPVTIGEDLTGSVGRIEVVVQLSGPALAASVPADTRTVGPVPGAALAARTPEIVAEQDALAAALTGLGAIERARLQVALNAVVVDVDARQLPTIAALPGVRSIRRLRDYRTTQAPPGAAAGLAEAAAHIGATSLHAEGVDGTGVRVAVLDTGIDYTHAHLDGAGTTESYAACADGAAAALAPEGACAAAFGASALKVKGGFDFVGERWPDQSPIEEPDPNPIDRQGHGTHVADIVGGRSADGTHRGIAPGVDLYAVKVCSTLTPACSGLALLQGVDYALDPDGDGDVSDAVDLINLSLGEEYGQGSDDLTEALASAAQLGVLVVTSAGNGDGRPYSVSSPSTSPLVLSVAETALPGTVLVPVTATPPLPTQPGPLHAVPQPWAPPVAAALTAPAIAPGVVTGCSPTDYAEGVAPGAVAVVRRGACAVSTKSDVARQAGAAALVVVNDVDGPAPTFSADGPPSAAAVPTLAVTRVEGERLLAAAQAGGVTLTLDPTAAVDLARTVASTSSRGPTIDAGAVKPDVAAPGAWRSAAAGTGTAEAGFGGTSGAAPTVAGAAALLLQRFDRYPPSRLVSMLVGSAEPDIRIVTADGTARPAPVTRVGGGEVRVDRAATLALTARGATGSAGVSFGAVDVTSTTTLTRTVTVQNLTPDTATYAVTMAPSDPQDGASAAVSTGVAPEITLAPFATVELEVRVTVDAAALPPWAIAGRAGLGTPGDELDALEVDGTITLTGPTGAVHVPWQVLPRRASAVQVADTAVLGDDGRATLKVRNVGASSDARLDVFSLTGTSTPAGPGAAIDLAAVGVRADATNVQFALATFDRRAVPRYPGRFEVQIDSTGDGVVDHYVFNAELGGFGASGREVVLVQPAVPPAGSLEPAGTPPTATGWFATATDLNSATSTFTVPLAAIGATEGTTLRFDVVAYDGYTSGMATDLIAGQAFTIGSPRYSLAEGLTVVTPAGAGARATVQDAGASVPSSETGLLVLTGADALGDYRVVTVG